jgi:glycosyltransferase involved in cell wall biosynthesis
VSTVTCVSHFFESHRGGIEIVAGRLARELAAHGHAVRWLAGDASAAPEDTTVEARPLRVWNGVERRVGLPFPVPSPRAVRALDRAVADSSAIVVHDALYLTSVLAVLSARRHRRGVVLVQHIAGIPFRSPVLRAVLAVANRLVTRPMLAAADQVVYISQTTAEAFGGVRYRRAPALIFNGVDTDVFKPPADAAQRAGERAELGLPAQAPVALFVGRFVEKKGLTILRELARRRSDVHWAFAGWGPLDPDEWALPNVSVHRDLTGPSLARAYRAADVFVLPSTGEGFPLVVQEAMACGTPVVCGSDSALADPDASALLTGVPVDLQDPAGTATAFAAALDRVVDRPAAGDPAGELVAYARARYSWQSRGDRYSALITELVSGSPRAGASPAPSEKAS